MAATFAVGAAHAGVLSPGHKAGAEGAEPVCTTVTTVVRRGDVVLSTTSSTHCEEERGQAPGPTGAAAPGRPASGSGAVQTFGGSPSMIAKMFGAQDPGLKPRDVLGIWSAIERGQQDACRVQMMREPSANGFRVLTIGCKGALAHATAWKFDETQAALYDARGGLVAKVGGDRQHLSGLLVDGHAVNLIR
jgi:hypothetical protein